MAQPENDPSTAIPVRSATQTAGASRATTAGASRTTTDVALVATFAALIAVAALLPSITVAGMAVPITLQTFAVMLAGVVLGARRGALATGLYLVVGLAGLPVFAQGAGGLAVMAGPSFGYLIAFPLAAALAGYVASLAARVRPGLRPAVPAKPSFGYLIAFPRAAALAGYVVSLARRMRPVVLRPAVLFGAAMTGSLVFIHPIGIAVMGWRLGLEPGAAIRLGATFLPGDVIKNLAVAVVADAVFRAFPDMLRQRR